MSFRIIATDLDGTLLDAKGELSRENYDAITGLEKAGVSVVPISGRAKGEIPRAVLEHPSIRYIITSSGAVLEDLRTGERTERLISADTVKRFYEIVSGCEVIINTHNGGVSYLEEGDLEEDYRKRHQMSDYFKSHFSRYAVTVPEIKKHIDGSMPSEFFVLFFHSNHDKEECCRKLSELGLQLAASDAFNLEITSPEAGKGNMIRLLCERLGVSENELITVGDSRNDIPMMGVTPNSYAVANACDELKRAAKNSAPANTEHIMKFFLDSVIY